MERLQSTQLCARRYEAVYATFTGSVLIIAVFRSFLFFEAARRAGTRMHHRMARSVLHAPLAFFHTNPSGRVLNRFSKVGLQLRAPGTHLVVRTCHRLVWHQAADAA